MSSKKLKIAIILASGNSERFGSKSKLFYKLHDLQL